MTRDKWVWMPHPAHLVVARWCQFHLATYVGGYIVSTVGEYVPDETGREILASSRGIVLEGKGDDRYADYMQKIRFEEIGAERKYETLVFSAGKATGYTCGCAYKPTAWLEVDGRGYNEADAATRGHLELCDKYAREDTQ